MKPFYRKSKKIVSPSGRRNRRRSAIRWERIIWLVILAGVSVLVYVVFVSDIFTVKRVVVSGNSELKADDVSRFVFDRINSRKFFLIRPANALFVSEDELKRSLLENFSILRDVSVRKILPVAMDIRLQEKNISTIWCRDACYWLDEDGSVYRPVDKSQVGQINSPDKLIILDENNSPMKAGDRIAEAGFLDFAGQIKQMLKDELSIDFDNIKTPGAITNEIFIQTRQNWQIFFDAGGSAQSEVRLLKEALKEKITPDEIKNLDYVDLRTPGKVFYKLKESPVPSAEPKK